VTRRVRLDVIGLAPEVNGDGGVLVGDQVAITIEVELVRKSGA